MNTKALRQKILDLAIRGKLVEQDESDEPASALLQRIREEKERLIREGKIKRPKKTASSDTPHYHLSDEQAENVPFEVPEAWEWVRLGDIGTWQSGATPNRLHKDYYGGDIPWLKTGDLNDGYVTAIPENITQKALDETSVKLNPTGSVLIAMYGATIGKVGILTFPATTNQACCACTDFTAVDALCLFYFLQSHKEEFIKLGMGGAQPNISKEKIIETFMPLPPLAEQRRIVAEIEKWFALIDKIERGQADLAALIEQAKGKILDLAIHGKLVEQDESDEPAIDLLRRINPDFKPSDTSRYENLPSGWELCKLSDVLHPLRRATPQGKHFYYADIDSINNKTNTCTPKKIETRYAPSRASRFTQKGDVVFSMVRPYLKNIAKIEIDGCIASTGFYVCSPTAALDGDYCFYLMISDYVVNGLNRYMKGDNSPSINIHNIEDFLIPLPPLAEQQRIVARIRELFATLDVISQSLL